MLQHKAKEGFSLVSKRCKKIPSLRLPQLPHRLEPNLLFVREPPRKTNLPYYQRERERERKGLELGASSITVGRESSKRKGG